MILNYGLVSFSSLSVSVVPENKQSHADHGTPWHTIAHHGTPTPWQSTSGHGTAHRLVRRIKNPFQTFFCTLLLYFIMVSLLSAELHRNGAFSVFNVREWIISIKVKAFTCLRFPTSLVASSLTSLASHSTSHCKSVTGPQSS